MAPTTQPATPTGVPLSALVERFDLEVLTDAGRDLREVQVRTAKVNRPGLQWAGYSEHFPTDRVQVIGQAEMGFLLSLPEQVRFARLEQYAQLGMPAVIVARAMDFDLRALDLANSYGIPVLRSPMATTDLAAELRWYLALELAPRVLMHAGLVDVAGEGVLIVGEPGIGKSETALELIRRGHRLVADDTVEIRRPAEHELVGRAPGRVASFMEIKGIGIVNLRLMYGIGSVKATGDVSVVVSLVRLEQVGDAGPEPARMDILGVDLPLVVIPVRPGRNTAVLIETAAMDVRAGRMLRPGSASGRASGGRAAALGSLP